MTKFAGLTEGNTVNMLYKGVQTTGIVIHKSVSQISVRFWNPNEINQEAISHFTTNGVVRYMVGENSKIISRSL